MTAGRLDPLEPALIGGLFGRRPSLVESSPLRHLEPRARVVAVGLAVLFSFLTLVGVQGALAGTPGIPSVAFLLLHPKIGFTNVGFSLLQDPVGLAVVFMVIATPIFCAVQVDYIHGFIAMNERNITYRLSKLEVNALNDRAAKANREYRGVGGRVASIFNLIFSGAVSYILDRVIEKLGLLVSWHVPAVPAQIWRERVYAGWWANPVHHFTLAVALWLLGTYYFYFLNKELAMGYIFMSYVQSVMLFDFGVTPNLKYNTDGYWGLRELRHFMQWTYCSTLGNFIMALGVFVVWLPFRQWTVLVVITVMIINVVVAIYPSILALRGAVREKTMFVEQVIASRTPRAVRDTTVANVWTTPNLPFHIRSTLTAGTIYLLIPLLLALVSALLTR